MNTNSQARARWSLAGITALVGAGLAFGLYMLGPDLSRDFGRLESWQLALVLVGDAVVLFWFLFYVTRHCLLGEPFPASSDHPAGADWGFGAALFSLLAALILDLTVTIYLQTEEYRRFAAAEVVDGECHTLLPRRGQRSVSYDLGCRFTDQAGNRHEASFYVGGIRDNRNDDLSPELLAALLREQVPFPVKISYDSGRPARVWLTGLGGRYHGWSIHILSNLFVFMQVIGLFIFLGVLASYRQRHDHNPWWLGLHKAFPLVVQATGLMLMGIAELIRP